MENEKINLINFEKCRNIKLEDVSKFLQENNYNWTGLLNYNLNMNSLIEEFETNTIFYFNTTTELEFKPHNHFLICTENVNDNHMVINYKNRDLIRYVYFEISTFKVYSVIKDKHYPRYLTTKLEKDLSKEWVKFLSQQKETYKESLIQLMIKRKKQAEEELESSKKHVINEKAKLDKYLKDKILVTNKDLISIDITRQWIEELN